MKKWPKRIVALALVAFAALQLTNPSHVNPPVLPGHDLFASNAPPPEIGAMLHNSCYDCHSFETKWPWYGYVAPVSWMLARDVKAARSGLNFSDWPHDDPKRIRKRWKHIADDVESGEMPMPSFTKIHPQARLSDSTRAQLVKWAKAQSGSDD